MEGGRKEGSGAEKANQLCRTLKGDDCGQDFCLECPSWGATVLPPAWMRREGRGSYGEEQRVRWVEAETGWEVRRASEGRGQEGEKESSGGRKREGETVQKGMTVRTGIRRNGGRRETRA